MAPAGQGPPLPTRMLVGASTGRAIAPCKLSAVQRVELCLGFRDRREKIKTPSTVPAQPPPFAYQRRVPEKGRLDRQDVEARHVAIRIASFEASWRSEFHALVEPRPAASSPTTVLNQSDGADSRW